MVMTYKYAIVKNGNIVKFAGTLTKARISLKEVLKQYPKALPSTISIFKFVE